MEHDNFIGIQKARGRKNAHHSLGMRFYSSHALSVELSAFAWSANESIIHHWVYACACVCWCALFVWSSGRTIDTTAEPNASYCQLFISPAKSTLYLYYIFWCGHESWIRNINFLPIGWLGEFFSSAWQDIHLMEFSVFKIHDQYWCALGQPWQPLCRRLKCFFLLR